METPSENQDYCSSCNSIALKTTLKRNKGICQKCKRDEQAKDFSRKWREEQEEKKKLREEKWQSRQDAAGKSEAKPGSLKIKIPEDKSSIKLTPPGHVTSRYLHWMEKLMAVCECIIKDKKLETCISVNPNGASEKFRNHIKSEYPFIPDDYLEFLEITDGAEIICTFAGEKKFPIAKENYSHVYKKETWFPMGWNPYGDPLLFHKSGRIALGRNVGIEEEYHFIADSFSKFMGEVVMGQKLASIYNIEQCEHQEFYRERQESDLWLKLLINQGWLIVSEPEDKNDQPMIIIRTDGAPDIVVEEFPAIIGRQTFYPLLKVHGEKLRDIAYYHSRLLYQNNKLTLKCLNKGAKFNGTEFKGGEVVELGEKDTLTFEDIEITLLRVDSIHERKSAWVNNLFQRMEFRPNPDCLQEWCEMSGSKNVRFCSACHRNVFSLTDMPLKELVSLIKKTENSFKGFLYLREDGAVTTKKCEKDPDPFRFKFISPRTPQAAELLIKELIFAVRPSSEIEKLAEGYTNENIMTDDIYGDAPLVHLVGEELFEAHFNWGDLYGLF